MKIERSVPSWEEKKKLRERESREGQFKWVTGFVGFGRWHKTLEASKTLLHISFPRYEWMDLWVHLGSYRCFLRSDLASLISITVIEVLEISALCNCHGSFGNFSFMSFLLLLSSSDGYKEKTLFEVDIVQDLSWNQIHRIRIWEEFSKGNM